jgi:uroporphyrinogen-III decarboxylase
LTDFERILKAVSGDELDYVPPVLWAIGQSYAPFAGIPDPIYYTHPEKMLQAQTLFFRRFPHTFTIPGIWPDMGSIPIASAFGCEVEFPENSPPRTRSHALQSLKDARKMPVPNPAKTDFTKTILKYLRFFKENIPQAVAGAFGFLDGHVHLGGPVDRACLVAGHQTVFLGMYEDPDSVHCLIDKIVQFSLHYIEEQQEIVGAAKKITMSDHTAGLIGEAHFNEFVLPKLNRIFDETDAQLKIYHNENNWNSIMHCLKDLRCNVIHAGPELDWTEANRHLHQCIMGVLDPIRVLAESSCETIRLEVEKILLRSQRTTKLWFSTGGGMHPLTPVENMECMVKAVKETSSRMVTQKRGQ